MKVGLYEFLFGKRSKRELPRKEQEQRHELEERNEFSGGGYLV